MKDSLEIIELTQEKMESIIYEIRGQKVMLDFDLARIYGYETKRFNEQVKNNIEKFPDDMMFCLTDSETKYILRSKKSTANELSSKRRYNPYAFTEQGIYMLMTVLRGELATKQSLALIRLFKQMKDYIIENRVLLDSTDLIKMTKTIDKHSRDIKTIKHDLKEVMSNFIDPNTYKHFLIMNGEKIEADLAFKQIYALANKSIIIIDNYISIKTLELLRSKAQDVKVTIITDNVAFDKLTVGELEDFISQTGISIMFIENNNKIHDRFIILDYENKDEKVFLCGSSSKDAGSKITTIMVAPFPELYHPLIAQLLLNPPKTID